MTRIDILSDPICPWCYIGKTFLDQALADNPKHDFRIEWHPYQLNPEMPAEGMDRRAYLEGKFGGKEGAVQAYLPVQQMAEQAGLTMNFDKIERTPNTINAHRLIHWSGIEGRQNVIVERLFEAYFRDGLDISNPDILVDIASAAGLDGGMIAMLLTGPADFQELRERDSEMRQKGVTGVPCFIVDGKYVVQGAQTKDMCSKVIQEITANRPENQA